jgi:hypothetical protein
MISQNGVPMSFPVVMNRFSLSMNSSWDFCISSRFWLASLSRSGVNLRHSGGGFPQCCPSESVRAKKSPQLSQKKILNGCASVAQAAQQWCLNFSHPLSSVSGQSLHLIWSTPPTDQSCWVDVSSASCTGLNFLGKGNCLTLGFCYCCSVPLMCTTSTSTLPSTKVS